MTGRRPEPSADYAGEEPFRPAPRDPLLHRAVPLAADLPRYRPGRARRDVLAGLTVAALAVPSAMAYAELAGLPAVVGLYALLLPAVAYALLGSSQQLIVGPEGSISALVAAAVLPLAAAGSTEAGELAATLALIVAACFVLARVLRLGWVADYLSRPVLVGYIHGVVVVLVAGQAGKLLGLDIDAVDPLPQLLEAAREIDAVNAATVALGAGALVVLLGARAVVPRLPAALVVVAVAIGLSAWLDLDEHGVAVVGDVPAGLPAIAVPTPSWSDVLTVLPAGIGIFLLTFADEVLTARSFAGRHGAHVRVGQELVAMGAASATAGLSHGMPIGASGSRTAVNDAMGARTQVAALLAAAVIALVLLFLTGPIADLPKAVLGAVIVTAAIGLIDVGAWRALGAADRVELAIAAVTTAGVVLTGVLEAIGFAVGLSIIDVVRRSARPHDAVLGWVEELDRWADVSRHPSARVVPGVVVYRLDDRLFFANASYVKGRVREALRAAPSAPRGLVLDAEGLTDVDAAGSAALEDLTTALRRDGVTLHIARMKAHVLERLEASGAAGAIGAGHVHPTVRAAVEAARQPGASGDGPPATAGGTVPPGAGDATSRR